MRWLHRLLNHFYQVFTQRVQVHLIAQRVTESRYDFGCVIFTAVEATSALMRWKRTNATAVVTLRVQGINAEWEAAA